MLGWQRGYASACRKALFFSKEKCFYSQKKLGKIVASGRSGVQVSLPAKNLFITNENLYILVMRKYCICF